MIRVKNLEVAVHEVYWHNYNSRREKKIEKNLYLTFTYHFDHFCLSKIYLIITGLYVIEI